MENFSSFWVSYTTSHQAMVKILCFLSVAFLSHTIKVALQFAAICRWSMSSEKRIFLRHMTLLSFFVNLLLFGFQSSSHKSMYQKLYSSSSTLKKWIDYAAASLDWKLCSSTNLNIGCLLQL
jgi:hypothetical protein